METPSTAPSSPQTEPARFAVLVVAARTQRQMSRQALAEQAGISLKALEDLERGYPVPHEIASAVCRNLDLPEPSLDTSPLVRLALRLRERRGQARLSRAQLARKVGVSTPIIRSLETATMRPSQEVCIGLLGVKALELRESDVAAFLNPAVEGAADGSPSTQQSRAAVPETPQASRRGTRARGDTGSHPLAAGRPSALRLERAADNPVVASIRVRVHANGKVCIEVRPPPAKLERATGPE